METLVLGATGATGKHVVKILLDAGHKVKAMVRSIERLPESIRNHDNLHTIVGTALETPESELSEHLQNCGAVVSCLGHNLTFRGVYGKPRQLVTDTVRRVCGIIRKNKAEKSRDEKPTKYILMNTAGNQNRDINEEVGLGQRVVIGLIRLALPPHADNEAASDYLRLEVGQNDEEIEWVVVRPDTLIDSENETAYEVHPSPTGTLFNPGVTSRINTAHFMAELVTNENVWETWKGQMPCVYNSGSGSGSGSGEQVAESTSEPQ